MAIYVRDIEESRKFYRGFLGLEEPFSFSNPDGTLRATLIKISDCQTVQLIPRASPLEGRLAHVGLETDDAEGMRLYLKSRGIAVPDQVQKGRFTAFFFAVKDPGGNTVEFMQLRPESWTTRDFGQHLPPARMATHLAYVGIPVRDPAGALAFYRDVLGCGDELKLILPPGPCLGLVVPDPARRQPAHANDPDGILVEFIPPRPTNGGELI